MENDSEIKKIIVEVSNSLKSHGYDPVAQLVGYLISNDLGYIPKYNDNRKKITKLDRTVILEEMLRNYLK